MNGKHPCLCSDCLKARDAEVARVRQECIRIVQKWFFASNKDARECVKEMQALLPKAGA